MDVMIRPFQKEGGRMMTVKHLFHIGLMVTLLFASLAFTHQNAAASGSCPSAYIVQRGDWLAKIARICGITLTALSAANPGVGNLIYPGQTLTIPGGYTSEYYCGPTYSPYYGNYYVVCRGDTLAKIARYYGVGVWYLQQHNNIVNANLIYAGQFIYP
jgi:LysM repeat protein